MAPNMLVGLMGKNPCGLEGSAIRKFLIKAEAANASILDFVAPDGPNQFSDEMNQLYGAVIGSGMTKILIATETERLIDLAQFMATKPELGSNNLTLATMPVSPVDTGKKPVVYTLGIAKGTLLVMESGIYGVCGGKIFDPLHCEHQPGTGEFVYHDMPQFATVLYGGFMCDVNREGMQSEKHSVTAGKAVASFLEKAEPNVPVVKVIPALEGDQVLKIALLNELADAILKSGLDRVQILTEAVAFNRVANFLSEISAMAEKRIVMLETPYLFSNREKQAVYALGIGRTVLSVMPPGIYGVYKGWVLDDLSKVRYESRIDDFILENPV